MGFEALFYGGIKSGKSSLAESYTLKHSSATPIYLATTEFIDEGMQERITIHKQRRQEHFITVEEPLQIANIIDKQNSTVLLECVSMWINNMLYHKKTLEDMLEQLQRIANTKSDVICVMNDVSRSVIAENTLVREFVDDSGIISQFIAKNAKEVYTVDAGIGVRIK